MSYDPSNPYQPSYSPLDPYGTYPAPPAPRRRCRTAAIVQFAFAGLMLLCGGCCSAMGLFITSGMVPADALSEFQSKLAEAGLSISPEAVLIICGVICILPAIPLLILGFFVWRGVRAAIVTSIVLMSLGLLLVLVSTVLNLLAVIGRGPAELAEGLCSNLLLLGVLLLHIVLLVRAYREAGTSGAGGSPVSLPYPPTQPGAPSQPPMPSPPTTPTEPPPPPSF